MYHTRHDILQLSQINRAYRKKALKYHPDKNPDDPNAGLNIAYQLQVTSNGVCLIAFSAEMFQRLSQVLAVLTDPVARASYDRWQRAKLASKKRHEELTAKRRKLKEQLEERESQQTSTSEIFTEREAAANMQKEVSSTSWPCLCALPPLSVDPPDREAKRRDPAKDPGTNRTAQTADGQGR